MMGGGGPGGPVWGGGGGPVWGPVWGGGWGGVGGAGGGGGRRVWRRVWWPDGRRHGRVPDDGRRSLWQPRLGGVSSASGEFAAGGRRQHPARYGWSGRPHRQLPGRRGGRGTEQSARAARDSQPVRQHDSDSGDTAGVRADSGTAAPTGHPTAAGADRRQDL